MKLLITNMRPTKAKAWLLGWYSRFRWVVVQIFMMTLLAGVLLWTSVFLYGAFYFSYMPAVVHETPVQFKFRTDCKTDDRRCSFPVANVSLLKNDKEVLVSGVPYAVRLDLELPESDRNQQIGMFMVHIEFYSYNGEVTFTTSHSTMMNFKSGLLRTMETLIYFWPSFFFDTPYLRQVVSVNLCDSYLMDPYRPTVGASVEIQTMKVEVYKAALKVHAKFTGLRYLLYNWPLLAAVCGITSNFCLILIAVLFFWCAYVTHSTYSSSQQHSKSEIDETPVQVENVKMLDSSSVCCTGSGDNLEDNPVSSTLRHRSSRTNSSAD